MIVFVITARDIELRGRGAEIAVRDGVVALEHRARLVAGELHRHALGHAGAYQHADGRPAQVVAVATRLASG